MHWGWSRSTPVDSCRLWSLVSTDSLLTARVLAEDPYDLLSGALDLGKGSLQLPADRRRAMRPGRFFQASIPYPTHPDVLTGRHLLEIPDEIFGKRPS